MCRIKIFKFFKKTCDFWAEKATYILKTKFIKGGFHMKGKKKCKILKEIRQQIADSNGIEYVTSECKHQGDCLGTCPKCEAELKYLEQELEKRQKLGKTVAVAGLTAVIISSSGCAEPFSQQVDGEMVADTVNVAGGMTAGTEENTTFYVEIPGEVPTEGDSDCVVDVVGELLPPEEYTDEVLMGDMVEYFTDEEESSDESETEVELMGDIPG